MANCKKCGEELNPGAKFCPKCGEPVSSSDSDVMSANKDTDDVGIESKPQRKGKKPSTTKPRKRRPTPKKKTSFLEEHDGAIIIGVVALSMALFILWWLGAFEGEIPSISNGRAAFIVENQDCKDYEVSNINKIILYEGNSRQDCKVEGTYKNGETFTLNGKWEKDYKGIKIFRKYYVLDFKKFHLFIDGDRQVMYNTANVMLSSNKIGDLKAINQEEENRVSEAFSKKVEETKKKEEAKRQEELKDYLGTYYYDYCPPGMPSSVSFHFKVTLNPDGTFSHEGNSEETRTYMTQSSLIDGKDFPSGGRWSVVNIPGVNGVFLHFEGNWGKGSINLDNNVLEIPNMNGYKLKVRAHKY